MGGFFSVSSWNDAETSYVTDLSGAADTTDVSGAPTDVSGAPTDVSGAPATGGGDELTAEHVQQAQDELERIRQQAEFASQLAIIKKKQAEAELLRLKAEREAQHAELQVANEVSTPMPQTAGTRSNRTNSKRRRTYKKRAPRDELPK